MASQENERFSWQALVRLICMGVTIAAVVIIFAVPGKPMEKLQVAMGYALLVLVFLFGAMVLVDIIIGKIDLSELIAEESGGASTSRFQLLIFTFVIAFSFFIVTAEKGEFPKMSVDVLALLGISATTYGVSKGIQATMTSDPSDDEDNAETNELQEGASLPPEDAGGAKADSDMKKDFKP